MRDPIIIAAARVRIAWADLLMGFASLLMRGARNIKADAQQQIQEWDESLSD